MANERKLIRFLSILMGKKCGLASCTMERDFGNGKVKIFEYRPEGCAIGGTVEIVYNGK